MSIQTIYRYWRTSQGTVIRTAETRETSGTSTILLGKTTCEGIEVTEADYTAWAATYEKALAAADALLGTEPGAELSKPGKA